MPGLLHITLTALLASCDAFRLESMHRTIPLSQPAARLFQDEVPAQSYFIQGLVRTKRHSVQQLVRVQPHLVHDMGWPEIHETSRSQVKMDSANSTQLNPRPPVRQDAVRTRPVVDENLDVEDEMERMVHLAVPRESTSLDKELHGGPGAGDASLEVSGFYGTDMEDRDRGEEGGEDRERRGGEDEWERDAGENRDSNGGDDQDVHVLDVNHTTPDLDALIGYSQSFYPSSPNQPSVSPLVELQDSGQQEHHASPVLEVGPLERELWEAEVKEDTHSSGYGVLHSPLASTANSVSTAAGDTAGTVSPETDTGTDFGLLGSYTKEETVEKDTERKEEEMDLLHKGVFTQNPTMAEVGMAPSREPLQPIMEEEEQLQERDHMFKGVPLHNSEELQEEEKWRKMVEEEEGGTGIRHIALTTDPSPTIGFTDQSWDWLERTTLLQTRRSEARGGGVTEAFLPDNEFDEMEEARQVVCVDWSELAGRGYVILNMTKNLNCEEFRVDQGLRLLKVMERVFARRMNSPEGSWVLYLSKPTHQQHQLLMNVASERGVIDSKDVLGMLGEIRKSLNKVGIKNYSAANSCQSRPSHTRSDYGKLFVVLVIIGSVCMVIITSGFIYICWQRRLPATKTAFRAEELHFVENGCHDNPMLDVTNDNQPEMQEKKLSTNGLAGGRGEGGGGVGGGSSEDSSRWQVFVNQAATEEEQEEQDTHL